MAVKLLDQKKIGLVGLHRPLEVAVVCEVVVEVCGVVAAVLVKADQIHQTTECLETGIGQTVDREVNILRRQEVVVGLRQKNPGDRPRQKKIHLDGDHPRPKIREETAGEFRRQKNPGMAGEIRRKKKPEMDGARARPKNLRVGAPLRKPNPIQVSHHLLNLHKNRF